MTHEHSTTEYCHRDRPDDGQESGTHPGRGRTADGGNASSAGGARTASDAANPRSEHAGICHRQGIARRRRSASGCRRKLHHRPDAQSRAGNGRAGRRAAGNGLHLHDELGRQQDLSRHRARGRHVWHGRSRRSRQARRDHQPSGSLHSPRGGLRPQAIRPRHAPRHSSSGQTAPTWRCSRRSTI